MLLPVLWNSWCFLFHSWQWSIFSSTLCYTVFLSCIHLQLIADFVTVKWKMFLFQHVLFIYCCILVYWLPVVNYFSIAQFCLQGETGSGYEFGDDSIVPSTPTLQVPQRSDGFAEAVSWVALCRRHSCLFSFLLLVSVSFCIVTCVVNSCCVFQNLLINFCIKSCSCRIFIALFCVAMAVTNFMQSVSSNLSQIELSNSV